MPLDNGIRDDFFLLLLLCAFPTQIPARTASRIFLHYRNKMKQINNKEIQHEINTNKRYRKKLRKAYSLANQRERNKKYNMIYRPI